MNGAPIHTSQCEGYTVEDYGQGARGYVLISDGTETRPSDQAATNDTGSVSTDTETESSEPVEEEATSKLDALHLPSWKKVRTEPRLVWVSETISGTTTQKGEMIQLVGLCLIQHQTTYTCCHLQDMFKRVILGDQYAITGMGHLVQRICTCTQDGFLLTKHTNISPSLNLPTMQSIA